MDTGDFMERLKCQLKIEEDGLKKMGQRVPLELIAEIESNRTNSAKLLNLFEGPLVEEGKRANCYFVKKGG